ncbi:GDP-D-glucose phosphorylase 1-like [Panonychus citri]|uniref:GDP-D-glucose phosphorylase 1-like n=1 Tax=Panonychus citri TaxID=50023 RepID=UPI0023081885|nr:GDP-D-glucose phosphorylase 1-like [Panonychus citri]
MSTKVELNCEMTCSKCEDKIRKSLDSMDDVTIKSIDIAGQQNNHRPKNGNQRIDGGGSISTFSEFSCSPYDIFNFSDDDRNYRLDCGKSVASSFDLLLERKWNQAQSIDNLFLFQFDRLKIRTTILPGKYGFVVTLNTGRGTNRRSPETINSISTPFDESKFNFNKIKPNELLFKVSRNNLTKPIVSIIINNSPIEYCSSLMVIDPADCHNQLLTKSSLEMAINLIAISGDLNLRMGFNSLGAEASVNHCHWHLYYQQERLYLQSIKTVDGHFFTDWPLPGFLFEISDNQSVDSVVESIMLLVNHVHTNHDNHSYNLFIARGLIDHEIRVFIWIRKVSFGSKNLFHINPALAELSGFFICKSNEMFNQIDEQFCVNLIKSIEIDNINEYIDLLKSN